VAGATIVVVAVAVITVLLGIGSYDLQIYALVLALAVTAAFPLIRRAVRLEPGLTAGLLWTAFVLKVVGSGLRYVVLKVVYHGVGDATGYHAAGVHTYHLVRHLDFSFIQPPYVDTNSIRYLTGFVYAVTGPSILAGFLLFSLACLLGQWWFYRAFTTAFPDGNHRLYGLLIFLLPSLVFWPSSIGKDAVMVFGLGLATYGLARLLRGLALRPVLAFAVGLTVVTFVRPPIGAIVVAGAGIAFVLQPSRTRTGMGRALAWTFGVPVVVLLAAFMFLLAAHWLKVEGATTPLQQLEFAREGLSKGGSSFNPPSLTNPVGILTSVVTAIFRPLPWEIGNPLVALAGLEGGGLLVLMVVKARSILRTLTAWRNGMAIAVSIQTLLLVVVMTGFSNFGLLVRQRTSLLPFLLMLPTAMDRPRRTPDVAETEMRPMAVPGVPVRR
jgi:hypothetical protein